MQPERTKNIGQYTVEEFYWNGKMVVYIDNKTTKETFELACLGVSESLDHEQEILMLHG